MREASDGVEGTAPVQPKRYHWDQETDDTFGFMVGPVPDGEWVKWADVAHVFGVKVRAPLLPHRLRDLLGHAVDMEAHGWKDAAETLRALVAAHAAPNGGVHEHGCAVHSVPPGACNCVHTSGVGVPRAAQPLPGLQTLQNVIECLRADARYVDEEGEATDRLRELLDAIENWDVVAESLDEAGVPRTDDDGATYSLWGRVERYARTRGVDVPAVIDKAMLEFAAKNGSAAAIDKLAAGVLGTQNDQGETR